VTSGALGLRQFRKCDDQPPEGGDIEFKAALSIVDGYTHKL